MKIYVAHSSSFDFKKDLYEPIRNSELNNKHEITLPHENSDSQFNSKDYLPNCDLVIAEVSYASTGMGIELGWADVFKKRIICIHKSGFKLSNSLKIVSNEFIEYDSSEDLVEKLKKILS